MKKQSKTQATTQITNSDVMVCSKLERSLLNDLYTIFLSGAKVSPKMITDALKAKLPAANKQFEDVSFYLRNQQAELKNRLAKLAVMAADSKEQTAQLEKQIARIEKERAKAAKKGKK